MKFYKVLDENGNSTNGGNATWSLPIKNDDGTWTPGEWMPVIEEKLIEDENGYHLLRSESIAWDIGHTIYEAEYRGEALVGYSRTIVRECRLLRRVDTWTDHTARLFAAWCAQEKLKLSSSCLDTGQFLPWVAAKASAWNYAQATPWSAQKTTWETLSLKLVEMLGE